MMNLAYDLCSVDPLLEEAQDRWGDISTAGGSEDAETDPPDVLEFWHARGDALLRSPTRENDPNAETASCRGGLPPFLLKGDVGETDPTDNGLPTPTFRKSLRHKVCLWKQPRQPQLHSTLGDGPPLLQSGRKTRSANAHLCHAEDQGPDRPCPDANHSKAGGNEWPRTPECMGEEPKRRGKWRASSSTEQSGRQPGDVQRPARQQSPQATDGRDAENSRAPC